MYSSCEVNTIINGQNVVIKEETNYPFDGKIKISIIKGQNIPLYFRIPDWSEKACVTTAGDKFVSEEKGYIFVSNACEGNNIEIEFEMKIKVKNIGTTGAVGIFRGPFAYSLRIPENYKKVEEDAGIYNQPTNFLFDNLEVFPEREWNFGLDENHLNDITVKEIKNTIATQPFSQKNTPIVLEAYMKKIPEWGLEDHMVGELQQSPAYSLEKSEKVELIPLGCARLRMSVFPIVSNRKDAVKWEPTINHIPLNERPKCPPNSYQA